MSGPLFRIGALRLTLEGLSGQISSWGGTADGPVARSLAEIAPRVGPDDMPDLVAAELSAADHVAHLRALAARAGRFVLVATRTRETVAGYLRSRTSAGDGMASHQELLSSCAAAGMMPARYIPVGEFSDRVYLLCEKPGVASPPLSPMLRPHPRPALATIAMAAIIVAYVAGIGSRGFWGENEAFFSLGARSVLHGHVLLPEQHAGMPVDQPPFAFWWIALVSAILGDVTELTARIANLVPALGTLAIMMALGRRWIDARAGILGAVLLATSYEFWENALEVNADMLLLFCLTGSWAAMLSIMESGRRRGTWWALWGLLAIATLTRGGVAPTLSAVVAVTYAFSSHGLRGGWRKLKELRPLLGSFVCVAPFALWAATVLRIHGPEPLHVIFVERGVESFAGALDHGRPWHYYLLELPLSYLPWSLAIPFMVAATLRRIRAGTGLQPIGRFAWVAIATVFVFFSASSSKRDYYILPLMPWLTLLTARTLWEWVAAPSGRRRAFWLAATASALLFSMAMFSLVARPILDSRKSLKPMAQEIDDVVDDNDRLILFDQQDPRLYFYIERDFEVVDENRVGDLAELIREGPELDILARANELDNLLAGEGSRLFLERVTHYKGRPYLVVTTQPSPDLPELVSCRVRKPAGIAWHAGRQSLFIASRLGEIAEVTLEGRRVHSRSVGIGPLDALAVGKDGLLYVASEREPVITVFDPQTLLALGRHTVFLDDPEAEIEGLCAVSGGGMFAVGVESVPSRLLIVHLAEGVEAATIASSFPLPVDEFRGLQADPDGGFLLVSSKDSRLLAISGTGELENAPMDLPGFDQEGVALAGEHLVICEASGWLAIWPAGEVLSTRTRRIGAQAP